METVLGYLEQMPWLELAIPAGRILLILVIAWVALRIIGASLKHFERGLVSRDVGKGTDRAEAQKRADTLVALLRKGLAILVWAVVGLMILSQVGIEIMPMLAGAGILGVAVGFGAQNLVRDVISGFFMIMENQIRVGDWVVLNGTGGMVEQMQFRTTVIRDLQGAVHIFPNGTITHLSNMTQTWSAALLDIRVDYKESTDRVVEVMQGVAAEMREDEHFGPAITEDLEVFGVDEFADSSMVVRVRLMTEPGRQWEAGREFRRRLKHAFDAEGIEIPFPHRTLYTGGANEPMRVEVTQVSEDAEAQDAPARQPE
ncbi:MAG: mechanosensitive ion channel family protein [Wenzhouxiangellaceae bacterium]